MEGIEYVPADILPLYEEVLSTSNSTAPPRAVFGMVREVTEALVVQHIPGVSDESASKLAERLRELPEHVNLAEPVLMAARAIQTGGAKGVHFARGKAVNAEHRDQILDMLEILLEYLYVIPEKARAAQKGFLEMTGGPAPAEEGDVLPGYVYIPPEQRKALDKKARAAGLSLPEFIKGELKKIAAQPD